MEFEEVSRNDNKEQLFCLPILKYIQMEDIVALNKIASLSFQ